MSSNYLKGSILCSSGYLWYFPELRYRQRVDPGIYWILVVCPPLKDTWSLDDGDRNVLETVERPASVKGIVLDGQRKVPFNLEV